jgi:hypothetical protein
MLGSDSACGGMALAVWWLPLELGRCACTLERVVDSGWCWGEAGSCGASSVPLREAAAAASVEDGAKGDKLADAVLRRWCELAEPETGRS